MGNNTATFNGTAAWAEGRLGNGITLDGDSDYITVTQNDLYDISTGDFTISAWVKDDTPRASLATYHRIVSWYDGTNNIQLGLAQGISTGRAFYIFNNSATAARRESTASIADSDTGWHHVVATKKGSTYTMYLNGQSSTGSISNSVGVFTGNSTTLYIGQRGDNAGHVDGEVDDVRIYNTALSAAEASELYQERYLEFLNNASTTDFTIESGTVVASSSVTHMSIAGDYTNSGTFEAGTATTTFNGTTQQTATGTMTGTSAFYNLEVTNNSASTTFGAPLTVDNHFKATQTNTILEFIAGGTTTLGSATITGNSGNEVQLRSTADGTQHNLKITGSFSINYADIKDSAACGSTGGGLTATSSIEGTNNTCWTFATPETVALSSTDNQTFYYGDATTTISTITITEAGSPSITAANDIRIKIATSSVGMLWATDDTTATFGGTASGKVSNPVTFEGNGSVLVIPVDSDFSANDTLTIADLSFAQFTGTTSSPVNALSLYTGGGSDTDADATDTYTIAIEPTIYLDAHSGGAIPNNFDDGNNVAIEILGFSLDPRGENINVDTLVVSLSSVYGVNTGDITNATLYRDMDSSRTYNSGDVQVGGAGTPSINGKSGTITFSTTFSATTTQDYILIADVAGTGQSDRMTVSIYTSGLTTTAESGGAITEQGNAVTEVHSRERDGGGVTNNDIGGAGAGSSGETGGGNYGAGDEINPDSGDGLSTRPEFNPPSSNGSPNSGWTTGGNAYVSDGNYATAATNALQHSFGNFGFTLSGAATILGIEIEIESSASTNAGDISVALSWDGGTSWTSAKTTATASTTDAVYTLGGSADTWGHAWTPAQTADGTFLVDVTANTSSNTLRIDAFQVRIYNEVGGGGAGGGGGEI